MFFDKYNKKEDGAIRFYDLHSTSTKILTVIIFIICILIMVVTLFPPVWSFLASFRTIKDFNNTPSIIPETFNFDLFVQTWKDLKFVNNYINSFIVVVGSAVCAIFFNGMLAYAVSIVKPKGHKIIFGLVMWSLLIPPMTSMVALFVNINKLNLTQSFIPLWLMAGANAFFVILFKQFFESLPQELIEAAKLDGASYLQTFMKIIIPLSKSIVMVIVIFTINAAWSDFLMPYLVLNGSGKETVMVRLFSFQGSNATAVEVLRAVVFSIVPPILLFFIFQKQITEGAATGALKG